MIVPASSYPGWEPSPPEPPGDKPNQIVLYRRNAGRSEASFGYSGYANAGNMCDVASKAFPAMREGLRGLGYGVGANMRLVFVCQIGFVQNLNLSGYFDTSEAEQVFMAFVSELNRYHFFLKSFQMDFVLLEPAGR